MVTTVFFDTPNAKVNSVDFDTYGYCIEIESPEGYIDRLDCPHKLLDDWIEDNVALSNENYYTKDESGRKVLRPVHELMDYDWLNHKDIMIFVRENARLRPISEAEFAKMEFMEQVEYIKAWRIVHINGMELSSLPSLVVTRLVTLNWHTTFDCEDQRNVLTWSHDVQELAYAS